MCTYFNFSLLIIYFFSIRLGFCLRFFLLPSELFLIDDFTPEGFLDKVSKGAQDKVKSKERDLEQRRRLTAVLRKNILEEFRSKGKNEEYAITEGIPTSRTKQTFFYLKAISIMRLRTSIKFNVSIQRTYNLLENQKF